MYKTNKLNRREGTENTFRAHVTLSNLAPVSRNLFHHTLNGSSQAVILSASSGTSRRLSSASVRVHANAATKPPKLAFSLLIVTNETRY